MSKIKIINTPRGEEPEWVRNALVGLRLPVEEQSTSGTENADDFPVSGESVIRILTPKNPEAADWWKKHVPERFVFKKGVCKLI